ncbi:MAG TPA: PfkB family carbohydrate kinase [Acidobacteriota bacterium]|jgi:rfaE bifunctional protein kinase chain/domain
MTRSRLHQLLRSIQGRRILVIGDFFLDKYLVIDPRLEEISLETGKAAHQVVSVRNRPGGAGTVTSNLAALGARPVALGMVGLDGEGWELLRGLREEGVDVDLMIQSREHQTGTYMKPMRLRRKIETETERLDLRRRSALPRRNLLEIVRRMRDAVQTVDAIIVVDAVPEDFGVVGEPVRKELARLGRHRLILADSRRRTGEFRNLILKPNAQEARIAAGARNPQKISKQWAFATMQALYRRSRKPLFMTAEAEGIFVYDGRALNRVPALPERGPIDVVGAGDCVASALGSSLAAGANWIEAAEIANLAASVTIHKLGTTGTASPREILQLKGT